MYRINTLLKLKRELYHTRDLALVWGVKNPNTLYTTIKRYIKKGILIPIHNGFYSTLPLEKVDPYKLAVGYLHRFAYVIGETVLIKDSIIFQKGYYITLVSDISKKFTIDRYSFMTKKLASKYLFNNTGIEEQNGVSWATVERAIADLLYFNPNYHFDNRKIINWKKVRQIQKEVGYYDSSKTRRRYS